MCMLSTSRREGYGLVVVEAAARATPSIVVAGEDNAAVELIEEGVNGFVAPTPDPRDDRRRDRARARRRGRDAREHRALVRRERRAAVARALAAAVLESYAASARA